MENEKDPENIAPRASFDGVRRIVRWQVSQKIGSAFFRSGLPDQRLAEIQRFLETSDFLKREAFEPRLREF